MKKTVKTALFAALVCFATSLFAAEPVSFLNQTTFGLFNDETVDNFAWGVDDANGLILGGFNSADYHFNVGAGKYIGPFWYSIFETGYIAKTRKDTESVINDGVSNDGVNIDYYDKDYTKTYTDNVEFMNNLFLSFAADNWGLQLGWKIVRNDPTLVGNDNKYHKTSTTSTEEVIKDETKTNKQDMTNTFSLDFNGIETPEFLPVSMFFRLDKVEFEWLFKGEEKTETKTSKTNGSIYGYTADKNQTIKTSDHVNDHYKTTLKGTMGLTMSESEALVSKFELGEQFDFTIQPGVKTVTTKQTVEDAGQEKTTKITEKTAGETAFLWTNVLSPKFIFEFEPDEKLSVNAAIGAKVSFGRTGYNSPRTITTVTKEVTENKSTLLSTKEYTKVVAIDPTATNDNQITDVFTTTVDPYAQLGLVYKIKPEKFNLNLGLGLSYSTLTWTTTTKTDTTIKESTYKTETDEAGYEQVTQDTENYTRNDTPAKQGGTKPAEEKTTTFTGGGNMAAKFAIGATWFMNDKVQMDIAYTKEFNNLAIAKFTTDGGLLGSDLKIQFSIKF